MNFLNSQLNAGEEAYDASAIADLVERRGESNNSKVMGVKSSTAKGQLVTITNSKLGVIKALCPANFNLELQAEWSQKNGFGAKELADAAKKAGKITARRNKEIQLGLDLTGMSGTTSKYLTGHFFEASAPIRTTIPLELIAESDPQSEVIEPLIALYSMAAPSEWGGILIPPGPSVVGTALKMGENISIQIGNIISFDNVIINSVSGEIDTRLDFNDNFFHVKVDIHFTSFFTVSRKDIRKMFGGG